MKRLLALATVVIMIFLPSCTVQVAMNPEIFISRFGEIYPPAGEGTQILFDGGTAYCCVPGASGAEMLIGMETDSAGTVTKVSLTGNDSDKAHMADFEMLAQKCITVFALEETEGTQAIMKQLGMAGKTAAENAGYYNTKWYRYAFVPTKQGCYFSVESRRSVPDTEIEFSLREAG